MLAWALADGEAHRLDRISFIHNDETKSTITSRVMALGSGENWNSRHVSDGQSNWIDFK